LVTLIGDLLKEYREKGFDPNDPVQKQVLDTHGEETGIGKAEDVIAHLKTLDPAIVQPKIDPFFDSLEASVNNGDLPTVFGEDIKQSLLVGLEHLRKEAHRRFSDPLSLDEQNYTYRLVLHLEDIQNALTRARATWTTEELTIMEPTPAHTADVTPEQVIVEETPTPTVEVAQPKEAKKSFLARLKGGKQ
jgi:hypothetical protein